MRGLLRVLLWAAEFAAVFVALLFVFGVWVETASPSVGRGVANAIGMSLPGLAALWILFLARRHAQRRSAVLACAIAAGLLVAAQAFVVTILWLYSRGFGASSAESDAFAVLLGAVLLGGGFLIYRFIRTRWPRDPADA